MTCVRVLAQESMLHADSLRDNQTRTGGIEGELQVADLPLKKGQ